MGLIDSLFSSGSSLLGSYMSYQNSKKLMKYNYDLSTKYLKNYYSNSRTSLENAGYNPLLAVGGTSAGNASSFSAGTTDTSGISEAGNKFVQTKLGVMQANASVKQQEAQTQLVQEQAANYQDQINADINLKNADTQLKIAQQIGQDLENKNTPMRQKLELENMRSQIYSNIIGANAEASNAETNRLNYGVNTYNAVTSRYNANTERTSAMAQVNYLAKQGKLSTMQAKQIKQELKYMPADKITKYISRFIPFAGGR